MSGGGDRKSSKAWQFFTDLQNDKARSSTAISELIEPTNPPNKEIFKHKSAAANTKLTQYFTKPLSAKKTEQLNKTLVKVFVKNYLPFHLVESPELKDFIKELNPAYQLPSRKTLSNALLTNSYNQVKEKIQMELN
ncbi:unnamed protein product [Euphydryas editha]|uniref:Uncharacterized protein n=1 Tax=Euphydryas editha TaxID=104508 RepID=A0AAU9TTC4_EUPED|nr:unnamed protein product [Euphydryas editha]